MLLLYMTYHNEARTHLSLDKDAPIPRQVQGGHLNISFETVMPSMEKS